MNITKRGGDIIASILKNYGPSNVKKFLWDKEFSGSKWDFIDNTAGDCIYPHLEKYAQKGDILDLGCGPGNTANELSSAAYCNYVGVDVSEVALAKAMTRTQKSGRANKNTFVRADLVGYVPTHEFDVILFRESLYHVPLGQILPIMSKYSRYLKTSGVFVVRLYAADKTGKPKHRVTTKIDLIMRELDIVESSQYCNVPGLPTVLVFRPERRN